MANQFSARGGGRENVNAAAGRFNGGGPIADVREFGNGNVNDTFLVTPGGAQKPFILQRLNTRVFQRPDLVMQNLGVFSAHALKRLEDYPLGPGRRWEIPRILITPDLMDHWIDPSGSFWRAMSFIEGAESVDTVHDLEHAEEIGRAVGIFHSLVRDLPAEKLADTLEGFHVTPEYLRRYDSVLAARKPALSSDMRFCTDFINSRRGLAQVLEDAKARGVLALRPIHGDPKANNILIDAKTRQAVAIVDLDTVKPGLLHYDIGDCLRSSCNPWGEDAGEGEARFEPDLCRAVLRGYFSAGGKFLTRTDREYIFDAVRLIAFELGLRFFTDYLEGNVYFKVAGEEQNLARALVQFQLAASIEAQEGVIRRLIREMP